MSNKTGGPAFPVPLDTAMMANLGPSTGAMGMTLRDYFAAKAMQGILTDPSWKGFVETSMAAMAYEVADAMLAERNKGE